MNDKIMNIMASVFDVKADSIYENSSPDTIANWDSMKHIDLILSLEEEFNLEFDEKEISEMMSFSNINKIINDKIN